jgi:hypothetical protein
MTSVFDSPVLPVVLELIGQGFRFRHLPDGSVQIAPVSRVPAEARTVLAEYREDFSIIVAIYADAGLRARCDRFRAQVAAARDVVLPAFVFVPGRLIARGACSSCGETLAAPSLVGLCWRCRLSWRLVVGVPVPSDLALPTVA